MKITSVNNDLVKNTAKLLQHKYREESELFLIEGEKSVEEAISGGIEIVRIFTTSEKHNRISGEIIETTMPVMEKISDTKNPPPIIAVAKQPKYNINSFKKMKRVVLLDGIKDAGNLGTIIRSAVAFNMNGIILYGNTVDLYNPKTVRSAVGNLWKIPIINVKDIELIKSQFDDYERIATLPKSEKTIFLNEYKPKEKCLIMLGAEADGLSSEIKVLSTQNLTIEMSEQVESLNLSVSASIIMYKLKL
ncbi:MAG: RNA methyltransferase [bacterium]|nr:RNA methyltransferase [bacterium]